jgi:polyisoprenoid-binding protein YceI
MNRLKSFALFLGISLAATVQAEPVTYSIDTKGMHASINFKIQHLGYSWLTGRFDDFEGTYTYDKDNLSNSQVKVEIDTASVNSNHAERDKHLRSDDFLSVSEHPQAVFESTSITGNDQAMKVTGDLTLNGVTRSVVIDAKKVGEGKDPWGGYRSGFEGTTTLKLADYDITKDLGPASTHVQLMLHLEGVRQ